MRRHLYTFDPVKIHKIQNTSLAISLETTENSQGGITIIRFYRVDFGNQTYTRIGIKTVLYVLYISFKSHKEKLSKLINSFVDQYPKYQNLLRN